MEVDILIKKAPRHLKELIGQEARGNRRSLNQEAIVLLEEALAMRAKASPNRRDGLKTILERYARATKERSQAAESVIEYDEYGLPR